MIFFQFCLLIGLEGWLKKLREKEVSKAGGKLRGMRESDRKNIDRLLQRILGQIMTSTRKSIGRQEELPALQRAISFIYSFDLVFFFFPTPWFKVIEYR